MRCAARAGIAEAPVDHGTQAEVLVRLAGQQQPGVRGNRQAAEFDAKLGLEREGNRGRFRVTRWVVPSMPARTLLEPHLMQALSDCRPVRSPFKSKMRLK